MAGSVVGSAIAFRLFLFFVPLLLFLVGLAGFFGTAVGPDDRREAGIAGGLAESIDEALAQRGGARWASVLLGVVGMATTGRTLSRTLVQASCLAWRLPMLARAPVRMIGGVIGLVVGVGLVSVLVNLVRIELGLGITGLSLVAAVIVYTLAWMALSALLPRATRDPGVLLPGAIVVALTLGALQAVSQLYLPARFERASELYGVIGVTIVVLGWFFFLGRAINVSMAVNAVVAERVGSISAVIFRLPVLRALPRRWPAIGRMFGLEQVDDRPP